MQGLGVFGLFQFLLGAGKALLRGAGTQGVHLLKNLRRSREALGQLLAHAGVLGPLAGKDECYLTHCVAPFRMGSAPSITSRTMSAAGWISLTMAAI